MIVFGAIRNGTLVRQPCSQCAAVKAEAHHEDYNKPLDVVWLCAGCHRRRHSEINRQKGIARRTRATVTALRTTLNVPFEAWQQIKAYRNEHRLTSNSKAIRELLAYAL